MRSRPIDLDRARLDPASVFRSPDEVVGDTRLTREQKIDILRRWAYDASELSVAESEGMQGGEQARIGRVLRALHQLTAPGGSGTSTPTQH